MKLPSLIKDIPLNSFKILIQESIKKKFDLKKKYLIKKVDSINKVDRMSA